MYKMGLLLISLTVFFAALVWAWGFSTNLNIAKLFKRLIDSESNHPDENKKATIHALEILRGKHETANVLLNLLEYDGAGEWPPRVIYDSWPAALQPYKDIYLELAPMLPCVDPLLNSEALRLKRDNFRSLMRKHLNARINMKEVEDLLEGAEAGNWARIRRDQLNGVYCAVAILRHAYRWATIPVVKLAQVEKVIEFPPELEAPWWSLQRYYGCSSESGNNTSNVLYNFDSNGERMFKINVGMSEDIVSSEESFFRLFYDVECVGAEIYLNMVKAIVTFENGDKKACLRQLRHLKPKVHNLFQLFYNGLVDEKVARKVWLSYCQGFQAWGVGHVVDGSFVKYDGLSGSHVLVFQAIDALFGMERYLTTENMTHSIPVRQREFTNALRRHSIRRQICDGQDLEIIAEIRELVNATKMFRASHRARAVPYLSQPAPERFIMTAGKSVLENEHTNGIEEVLRPLDGMMRKRLQQTS